MATDERTKLNPPAETTINVTRPAYDRLRFEEAFDRVTPPPKSLPQRIKSCIHKPTCSCTRKHVLSAIGSKVPLFNTLRGYSVRKMLVGDIIAGLSVGVMHIPQGLGFAILAGVQPVYGLYSSFWPVLIYAFLGTGSHVGIGTMALISLMINTVMEREVGNFVPSGTNVSATTPHTLLVTSPDSVQYGFPADSGSLIIQNLTLNISGGSGTGEMAPALSEEDRFRADIAASLTMVIALFQCAMGLLRLGVVSIFMPSPFVGGFTTGAAVHVVTSQIKFLLGILLPKHDGMFRLPLTWVAICKLLPQTNPATVIIGVICIITLLLIKTQINDRFRQKMFAPIPAELLVVVIACLVSYFTDLSGRYRVKIVKHVPSGMPTPSMPSMTNADTYIGEAFMIAVVSFSLTYSMGTLMGSRHHYSVGPNQEMAALGLAHLVTACFSGFAGTAAPPRCFVLDSTGGRTQISGLIAAVFLLIVLLVAGPLFAPLPNSVLAAIIIVAILPLFKQFTTLPQLWRVNKYDFLIWVITFSAVTFLDIDIGLIIGIVFAVSTLVMVALSTKVNVLGTSDGHDIYVPIEDYSNARESQGVTVIQFQGDLNFLSKDRFKHQINKILMHPPQNRYEKALNGKPEEKIHLKGTEIKINGKAEASNDTNPGDNPTTEESGRLIIDMSRVSYIDSTGIATLKSVQANLLMKKNTEVTLCCVSMSVLKTLEKAGMKWINGKPMQLFPTLADALALSRDL